MVTTRSSTKDKMQKTSKKDKEPKKAKKAKEPKDYMKKYRKDPDAVYREDRLKRYVQERYQKLQLYKNITSLQRKSIKNEKKPARKNSLKMRSSRTQLNPQEL